MIKILNSRSQDYKQLIDELLKRNEIELDDINRKVQMIVQQVKEGKDQAINQLTKEYDGVEVSNLEVSKDEIEEGYQKCENELINALEEAKENIWQYHSRQREKSWIWPKEEGIILGQKITPIEKVGIYVPGGTASYPSTVLMNTIPAKVAGVKEIIMVSPPGKNGKIDKNILAAAKIAGVDRIFKVGGAQAIGALAFGTERIPKVHKIVGPGNIYVALAKKFVYGYVDIDMIAGPSEILIIADESANGRYVAADMLSQAEHDTMASSILITTSLELAENVKKEIEKQTWKLARKTIIEKALRDFGAIIVVEDLDEAIQLSNEIAPEHLELMVERPFEIINLIKNAGAIFMGQYSPEPLGDYFAGPNHTLPTGGTAKFYSPLGVGDFIKKSSLIYCNKESLKNDKDKIIKLAESEGLTAHANSIRVRFEL